MVIRWIEFCFHTTNEAIEPVSNILNDFGANGVAIENKLDLQKEHPLKFGEIYDLNATDYPDNGVYIKAYFLDEKENNFEVLVGKIKERIDQLPSFHIAIHPAKITIKKVDEEDWATSWKRFYDVTKVSDSITIVPSWKEYQPRTEHEKIIYLDPGMAFGTGTHPTTKLSIQGLEKFLKSGDTVIDVGSGSGILSIASIKLGALMVEAYDLDEVAVKSARANIEMNHLQHDITVEQNDLLQGISKQVDLIVSNILAEVIVQFIPDAWRNLKESGFFITSGIIQEKKELVLNALKEQGFTIVYISELDEWVSIGAKK